MSGIAGIIRFNGAPVEPELIQKMTAAMPYRGPDGINHWVKGSVAMGQCMLCTTPESLEETQPLTNEDESLVLVMDGRIDNRQDIQREMRLKRIYLRSNTDAEMVLGAYQLWGEDCPRHLLGDFAFAIWDKRLGKLFCARDHIGVKPFYYLNSEVFFAFASEEDAFPCLPGVTNEPYDDHIAQLLVPEFSGGDFQVSWLRDIVKLPAGHALSIERTGRKSTWTYWQLSPQGEIKFASDHEYVEAFKSVFSEAIRRRLRTLGNPALMLSGGIDSVSISGCVRDLFYELPNRQLHTFSVVSDEAASCEETRNIHAVTYGHENHTHNISLPSFKEILTEDDLLKVAWNNPHPFPNSIIIPALMYQAAARFGSRVMYDGIDGDLVTNTPDWYLANLLRSGAWRQAWKESRLASVNHTYLRQHSPVTLLSKSLWAIYAPNSIKRLKWKLMNFGHRSLFSVNLINRDFAKNIHLKERLDEQISVAQKRIVRESDQERGIRGLTQQGIPWSMEAFDQAAARYSIEPRHPWSDKHVIEFYLRLPQRQKVRNGWTKWLVREAMAPSLDNDVCWHSGKNHLGINLVRQLMKKNREQVLNSFRITECAIEKYVDMDRLNKLLRSYKKGVDCVTPYQLYQIYETSSLGLWLSKDNPS